MGQKIHPYGFRVGITKGWNSRWFANQKSRFGQYVVEDVKIRRYVKNRLRHGGVARIEIERTGNEVRILLHTARPGIVIGRRGIEIDRLRDDLREMTGKQVTINVMEVSNPDMNAQLLAEAVGEQLLKRISFRRAMKRAVETAMSAGAQGVRVSCGGRLGGSEMSRHERYAAGKLPLQNLHSDIDYGFAEAHTMYGTVGVKVWIYKGLIEDAKQEAGNAADA